MKTNTQRKVAMWILGVALGALVLDKTVLAPGGASAATPKSDGAGAGPSAPPVPERTTSAGADTREGSENEAAGVSSRLGIALDSPKWTSDQVVGSLRPSPEWASGEPTTPEAPAENRGADFKAKHSLKAVMSGQSKRIALIDGRPMDEGDSLDGYTLISVGARSAVFESGADRIVLSLPEVPEKSGHARTDR